MVKTDPDTLTASERRLLARQLGSAPEVVGPPLAQRLARLVADGVRLGAACDRAHVGSLAVGRRLLARALVSSGAAQPAPRSRAPRRAPARGSRKTPATRAPLGGKTPR